MQDNRLPITVFSDFACPFSYVTEMALRAAADADAVEIRYRAYGLASEAVLVTDPDSPPEGWEHLLELAAAEDVRIAWPGFRPPSSKAHEAARFAAERGHGTEIREEIFAAYWADGRDIGRIDVLMEVVGRAGLDPEELKIALDIDRYASDVTHDREVALRLRIPGTPTLFLDTGPAATIVAGPHSSRQLRTLIQESIRGRTP